MKKDFLIPIVVLAAICIVISGALALTNQITAPIIAEAAKERESGAKDTILPGADGFDFVENPTGVAGILESSVATNGVGYVFTVSGDGYGGPGSIKLMIAIDAEGLIVNIKTLENSETKGIGTVVSEPEFEGQFIGMDSNMEGYEGITGATASANAYKNAVRNALNAYEVLSGQEVE